MYPISFKGNNIDLVYTNDIHSNTRYTPNFATAVKSIKTKNKASKTPTYTVVAGDAIMGTDVRTNTFMIKLFNNIGIDALAMGNKEIESGDFFIQALSSAKAKFKLLSSNLGFSRPNAMENKIAKSSIIEQNGEKVGFIGVTAFDSKELNYSGAFNDYVHVNPYAETENAVREEVKKLESQGINKIILLAHTGQKSKDNFDYYKNLANIGGIRIIVGGHDHLKVDEWHISERGEVVKILSAESINDLAKNSEELGSFGHFKAVFDDNGVLIPNKCKNFFKTSKKYTKATIIDKLKEHYLQSKKILGQLEQNLECIQPKTTENPVANLLADSMLWISKKMNKNAEPAQIAFINSGEIRSGLKKGKVSMQAVKGVYRFTDNVTLVETKLTKKQIQEALDWGIETTTFPKQTLGILQVGGLRYTVGKDNKAKDIYLTDQNGKLKECLDNMPDDKEYKVIYDTYLLKGSGGMNSLKKDVNSADVKVLPFNHQSGVIEYLKRNFKHKPIRVKTGRISIEI